MFWSLRIFVPGKSIPRLLSGTMVVLHSCGKDKPQASVTGDNDLPVCETSAERAHRCTCSWKHCIASSLERFDNKKNNDPSENKLGKYQEIPMSLNIPGFDRSDPHTQIHDFMFMRTDPCPNPNHPNKHPNPT